MSNDTEKCPYCQGTYPHQGPTGCDYAKALQERYPNPICGKAAWPYTENNICVLQPGHLPRTHKDARGREFDHAGYARKP